jgi:hypothetical protein
LVFALDTSSEMPRYIEIRNRLDISELLQTGLSGV